MDVYTVIIPILQFLKISLGKCKKLLHCNYLAEAEVKPSFGFSLCTLGKESREDCRNIC